MRPKGADVMANSVDPDQTAPGAVWSGSTLFAHNPSVQKLRNITVGKVKKSDLSYDVAVIQWLMSRHKNHTTRNVMVPSVTTLCFLLK